MNKRQLAAMAAAAMMLICMPTTAFAALGRPGQPSASVQQQVKSERKVIKKNVKETEEETAKWQQQMLVSYSWWGENINEEQDTVASTMKSWMASKGHKANILGENFEQVGFGRAKDKDGSYYWVQLFAKCK